MTEKEKKKNGQLHRTVQRSTTRIRTKEKKKDPILD